MAINAGTLVEPALFLAGVDADGDHVLAAVL